MLLLRGSDLLRACPMAEAIAAVREGFVALSAGSAAVPVRSSVPLWDGGVALTMPASLAGAPVYSVKVVAVAPGNPARGLPLVPATVLLGDAHTGQALALLEGASLTALRTGAAGGVAAAALARRDSEIAVVFGAGAQARTQVVALGAAVPRLREIHVIGRDAEHVRALVDWAVAQPELTRLALRVGSGTDREDWVRREVGGADIVVTATSSASPVFPGAALGKGVHITAVGSFRPAMRELDDDAMRGARIVVDQREAALAEAGELQGRSADDLVEIGEVLAGGAAGRTDAAQRTIFKSVGNAVQDLVVAARAYERASAMGIGEQVSWP